MLTLDDVMNCTLVVTAPNGGGYVCVADGKFAVGDIERDLFVIKRLCDDKTATMRLSSIYKLFGKLDDYLSEREKFIYELSGKLPTSKFKDYQLIQVSEL